MFAFGGLWRSRPGFEHTLCTLTAELNALLRRIHGRVDGKARNMYDVDPSVIGPA